MQNTSNTADLEARTNLSGQLSLRTTKDNIQEFLAGGHRRDLSSGERISIGGFGHGQRRVRGVHLST